MPCIVEPTQEELDRAEARRVAKIEKRVREQEYDPLLCSACQALTRLGYNFDENPKLASWWSAHQARDALREREERLRAARQARIDERLAALKDVPLGRLSEDDKAFLREQKVL